MNKELQSIKETSSNSNSNSNAQAQESSGVGVNLLGSLISGSIKSVIDNREQLKDGNYTEFVGSVAKDTVF